MFGMRRRDFVVLLGGAAVAWPLAARAQQPAKAPIIGFLGAATASAWRPWTAVFVQRLGDLGWIEGRTVTIEYRWAEGRPEFVRLKVDVIVTVASAVPALRQATSVIPIVFALANDPVGGGLVASLSRPGGSVTGLSNQGVDLAGKRLELLREVRPDLRRLAILTNVGFSESVLEMREAEAGAYNLGIEVSKLEIRRAADIALPSRHSSAKPTHSTWWSTHSLPPTARGSSRSRSPRTCQPSSILVPTSKPGL